MSTLTQQEIDYFSRTSLNLDAFLGAWYIVRTTLDFWKSRTNPTVTYTRLANDQEGRILDEVRFLNARGKPAGVVGYDRLLAPGGSLFQWVAKPWYLRFLKSTWGVVATDEDCTSWAVTYFSPTTFTAAGMDIYSRTPDLPPDLEQRILAQVATLPLFRAHLDNLFPTLQLHTG